VNEVLPNMTCLHAHTECLNEHELIRKYRCLDCRAVMMCVCDERIGRANLSHQLHQGTVLETQERVPVTAGFQSRICRECRGLAPEAHPASSIPGRTSKIKRYYWRELAFRQMELFDAWKHTDEGKAHLGDSPIGIPEFARQALEEIKQLHATKPKYVFDNVSQQQVLERYNVEVLDLKAKYISGVEGRAALSLDGRAVGVEEFACHHLRSLGYSTLTCESRPFHALFATLLWPLIQDPGDSRLQIVGMADRTAPPDQPRPLWWSRPEDFGTVGYGRRREPEIIAYLNDMLPDTSEELSEFFDDSLEPSRILRTYLWADEPSPVDAAKRLLELLTPAIIKTILRYLVDSYWANYLGWPDLIAHCDHELFFAEVKSSNDKLSDDQKHWIEQNHARLKLPFKLIKIHRSL
jgi:hypothetical protein